MSSPDQGTRTIFPCAPAAMTASCALRGVGERELAADDRFQRAVGEARDHVGVDRRHVGIADVEQRHAENRGVFPHRLPRVDLDAGAVADDDDSAAVRDQPEILVQVDVRGHFQDDVDAASAGGAHDVVEVAGRRVVEHVIRAVLAHRRQAAVGAAGADDRDAVRAGDLHGGEADAAGGPVHQHGFAGPRGGAMKQRAVRRRVGHTHRRALSERDRRRQAVDVVEAADGLLGVRAAVVAVRVLRRRAVDEHAIADGDGLHVRAHGLDLAAGVRARE